MIKRKKAKPSKRRVSRTQLLLVAGSRKATRKKAARH